MRLTVSWRVPVGLSPRIRLCLRYNNIQMRKRWSIILGSYAVNRHLTLRINFTFLSITLYFHEWRGIVYFLLHLGINWAHLIVKCCLLCITIVADYHYILYVFILAARWLLWHSGKWIDLLDLERGHDGARHVFGPCIQSAAFLQTFSLFLPGRWLDLRAIIALYRMHLIKIV